VRVALVYDLREDYAGAELGEEDLAEFDSPATIAALEAALRALGHDTVRIGGVHRLAEHVTRGARWDLVLNIAEGLRGVAREAQVPALLEAYELPYTFSDPLTSALTLDKAMAKRVLRDSGVPTAPFVVIERLEDVDDVALDWPLFVKPLAEGTAKGIGPRSRVENVRELREQARHILERYRQPALVEPYLPGREVTVGILGTGRDARVLGTLEVRLNAGAEPYAYTYVNKERCEELCEYVLAQPADAAVVEPLALAAWRALGARDGGRVDLRMDAAGRPMVLELNPLPGLHPTHSDLPMIATAVGMSYTELIGAIVASAMVRSARPGADACGSGAAHTSGDSAHWTGATG
jgi:D-alanine-D-alanine ligase